MSNNRPRRGLHAIVLLFGVSTVTGAAATPAAAQTTAPDNRINRANWELSNKFTPEALRRVAFSTNLQPRWIGKSDSLWYNWRDRNGSAFTLIYPPTKLRKPLFDHVKLAAALAEAHRKPYEPNNLPFTTLNFTKDHKAIRFTVESGASPGAPDWAMT